uniref:Mitochondrial 2-oxoglutarate/malate carrier protein n=1 Tax=Drosophila melanogaster TaxID=7227 RepID=A0AMJ5_DROME|nr:CG18418 [Drosophila melanogaster]CAL25808.1 CG18418 [Drosophila melanogaster]CAL25811.1 CG18418 [Drosophila melanogaster]CAL25815.1 CG18418 [Drosophila melanogaster]
MALVYGVEKKTVPTHMKFVMGGTSGMLATCIVQPLDLLKTRMQISGTLGTREYKNSFEVLSKVLKNEGILSLYNGLSAGLLRQATYTSAKMGVYQMELDWYRKNFGNYPSMVASMTMGIVAGAFGAMCGNPAEVALIRMMSDNRLMPEDRRNYKNVGDAFVRIVKDEGVVALWRGCLPTVGRAMVVNMVQLASYSLMKNQLQGYLSEGIPLHLTAALVSGLLTSVTSMPLDMAKTRIQQMKVIDGKPEYSGTIDVLKKVLKNEGAFAVWKGFTPYLMRMGPHTIFSFVFLEQMNKAYSKHMLSDSLSDSVP